MQFAAEIARTLTIRPQQAEAVLGLLQEGSTIPFIARYRKDKTGNLNEVQIAQVQQEAERLKEHLERKEFIEKTIAGQGNLTADLQKKLDAATTIAELEDLYLPFKPKRKTKAQTARENGLEPLANLLLEQRNIDVLANAAVFLSDNVATVEDALQGARDIIAEVMNEDVEVRAKMRKLFTHEATLQSRVVTGKEEEGVKYKDYFEFYEPISKVPGHRILAVLRGFKEGFLRLAIGPAEEAAFEIIEHQFIKASGPCTDQLIKAIKDSYRRLLQPALESEFRTALKLKGDDDAINVFAENLRQLLLSPPLGSKRILAIDPGFRTGCKVVCLDEKGMLLATDIIYVHEGNQMARAEQTIKRLAQEHRAEAFAIGDGTAGRETEQFIKTLNLGLPVFMVNEDGASVYSASEIAREEFPDHDITVRGSISIGRRLMDPLGELVKIEPKSIGVGQYQHDVNQARLKERLDQTVISCVNQVGVNLNTASKHLLSYVSGIGSTLAENIVKYRNETGGFLTRKELLKVPRLGGKAFEQCAGFLRISNGKDPLDASAVHPETYALVQQIAGDLGTDVNQLMGNEVLLKQVAVKNYVNEQFGELTIKDVLNELKKPGLDPRSEVQQFQFADVYKIEDVSPGMIVPGVVTNITRFGAFVDIGVKQDGLVHVSEIAHKYIDDPNEVLKLGQQVSVKVTEVDITRKRIALSIKQLLDKPAKQPPMAKKAYNPGNQEPEKIVPLTDALAMLKKKFGK